MPTHFRHASGFVVHRRGGRGSCSEYCAPKGVVNQFPDWGVSALFIIPTLIFVYFALTHETARHYYPLIRKHRPMTLLIFIAVGGAIGVLGWYAICKFPLWQPTGGKIPRP